MQRTRATNYGIAFWEVLRFIVRALQPSAPFYIGLVIILVGLYLLYLWSSPPSSLEKPPKYPNSLYFDYLGRDESGRFETVFTTNESCSDVIEFYKQKLTGDRLRFEEARPNYAYFTWQQPFSNHLYQLRIDCERPTTPAIEIHLISGAVHMR